MPKKHRISTKRAVIYGILGLLAVLLAAYVVGCHVPRALIPDKESQFEPTITHVFVGTDNSHDMLDQLDEDALMELVRSARYQRSVLPTGYHALQLRDDMIQIGLVWVPDRFGSGWSFWDIILTPEWQVVSHGDWNWMHPIEDGGALYEQVYELIYG